MSAGARSDRLNPVFLKELRQSLRGRTFAILFPTSVAIAVALAIMVIVDLQGSEKIGAHVFVPIFTVLGVALLGLVPFSTFQSMAGEWDEGTHDLLVLSHLSPARIVIGKLATAAVEGALYLCAFLPLLLVTFVLSGVDVRDVLFLVGAQYAASLALSCVAMSLAGLTHGKFWRVILLAALAGLGFLAVIASYGLSEAFVQHGRGVGTTYASDEVWATVIVIGLTGAVAFAFATTRIADREDDRSSPVRITLTALLAVTLLGLELDPTGGIGKPPYLMFAVIFGVISAIFAVGFVTEPERLPRRAATRVPRSPVLALLAAPFLPGGGRGVLWWMLHVAVLGAWAAAHPAGAPRTWVSSFDVWRDWTIEGGLRWASVMAYFYAYLAGLSLLTTRLRERSYGPLATRMILPSVAILSMVLPNMVGFLIGSRAWQNGEHALNPFWVMDADGKGTSRAIAVAFALVVLLANAPRLVRSVREILDASRARRAHAERRPEAAVHVA